MTQGAKAWIMFDGSLTPPGVYVSDDRATVEAPLSLAGWFPPVPKVNGADEAQNGSLRITLSPRRCMDPRGRIPNFEEE